VCFVPKIILCIREVIEEEFDYIGGFTSISRDQIPRTPIYDVKDYKLVDMPLTLENAPKKLRQLIKKLRKRECMR
jgi:hypothetical protein